MEKIIKVGVGLYIINDKKQVLLGLRKSPHGCGSWCSPGGHMEFGESNADAAVREAKEETGLEINPSAVILAGVTNDFFRESGKHYITLNLVTHDYRGTVKITEPDKCAEWRWFDLNNLPENLFLPTANFLAGHDLSKL